MLTGSDGEGGVGKGDKTKANERMSRRRGMWIACSLGATANWRFGKAGLGHSGRQRVARQRRNDRNKENVMSMWHIGGMLAGSDSKGGEGDMGKGGETKANERHQLLTADVRCVGVVCAEVAWRRSGGGRVSVSMLRGDSLGLGEGRALSYKDEDGRHALKNHSFADDWDETRK